MSDSGGVNDPKGGGDKRKAPPFLPGLSGLLAAAYGHRPGLVFARNGAYARLPAAGVLGGRPQAGGALEWELFDLVESWGRKPGGSLYIARWVEGYVDPALQEVTEYIVQAETLEFSSIIGGMRLGALLTRIDDGVLQVEEAELAGSGVRPKKGGHRLRVGAPIIAMSARRPDVIEKIYGASLHTLEYSYYHITGSNLLATPVLAPAPVEAFRRMAAWESPFSIHLETDLKKAYAVIDQMRTESRFLIALGDAGSPKHYQEAGAAQGGKDREEGEERGGHRWKFFHR